MASKGFTNKNIYDTVRINIRKYRKLKGMTQQELADKLGVTDRAISHWENGRRLPDYSLLKELCDTLSISINELFAGEKISNENYKMSNIFIVVFIKNGYISPV